MPNKFNLRTSSASLKRVDGLWIVNFSGVITKSDMRAFHEEARTSIAFGNFFVSDWRDALIAFTDEEIHNPACELYVGHYDPLPLRFGALLGRPDQVPVLKTLERFEVNVMGNVRRVFTEHAECMTWSEKISNFLDHEDAESRQACLFT